MVHDPEPLSEALGRGERGVQDRDASTEARHDIGAELMGQRYLGHEVDHLPPLCYHMLADTEEDLALSATGHAVHIVDAPAREYGPDRALLLGAQLLYRPKAGPAVEQGALRLPPSGRYHGADGLACGAEVHPGHEAGQLDELDGEGRLLPVDQTGYVADAEVDRVLLLHGDDESGGLPAAERDDHTTTDLDVHALRYPVCELLVERNGDEDAGEHQPILSSVPATFAASLRSSHTGRLSAA